MMAEFSKVYLEILVIILLTYLFDAVPVVEDASNPHSKLEAANQVTCKTTDDFLQDRRCVDVSKTCILTNILRTRIQQYNLFCT